MDQRLKEIKALLLGTPLWKASARPNNLLDGLISDATYLLNRLEAAEMAAKNTAAINQEMKGVLLEMRKGSECWCYLQHNAAGDHSKACKYLRKLFFRYDE